MLRGIQLIQYTREKNKRSFTLEGAQYDRHPLGTLPTPCSTRAYQELAPNSRESGAGPQYRRSVWACSRRVSPLLSESTEEQWHAILEAEKAEPIRNRLMLAIDYDAAVRRQELWELS